MTLHQLKTEAREEFDKYMLEEYGQWKIVRAEVKTFLDSIIDQTYHATKEEVRGMVENIADSGFALLEDSIRYAIKKEILATLEDTTTSSTVS